MVMIICYILIAVKLLHDVKSSRKNIGIIKSSQGDAPGTSTDPANTVGITTTQTARRGIVVHRHRGIFCVLDAVRVVFLR